MRLALEPEALRSPARPYCPARLSRAASSPSRRGSSPVVTPVRKPLSPANKQFGPVGQECRQEAVPMASGSPAAARAWSVASSSAPPRSMHDPPWHTRINLRAEGLAVARRCMTPRAPPGAVKIESGRKPGVGARLGADSAKVIRFLPSPRYRCGLQSSERVLHPISTVRPRRRPGATEPTAESCRWRDRPRNPVGPPADLPNNHRGRSFRHADARPGSKSRCGRRFCGRRGNAAARDQLVPLKALAWGAGSAGTPHSPSLNST